MPNFRYQALGPLPSSGASRAFLGLAIRDETRADPVVLVWVPDELAQDVEKSDRIQRETERAALLEHPHIIRVYGFARMDDGRLARVVEFGDGENLRRVLEATGPLPAPLAARLIADAAQGVHYAHLAGNDDGTPLLHGDLRPETLLVTFSGNCKVSGYGAAAFAPKENRGRTIRTAPEQVLGGRAAMNVQTDVYLLGATLFEALTGKAPFEDAEDLDQAVLTQDIDFARHPEIPEALVPVLSRALAKKAADRFPSALLLREALELSVQPLPDEAEVGRWLSGHFPDADGTRGERQRLIDSGIASFARAQWAKESAEPSARPPFPSVAPPPAELASAGARLSASEDPPASAASGPPAAPGASADTAAPSAAYAPGAAAPPGSSAGRPSVAAVPEEDDDAQPPRRTSVAGLLLGAAAILIASAAAWWGLSQRPPQLEPTPVSTALDAGVGSIVGPGSLVDAGVQASDAGETAAAATPTDAGLAEKPAPKGTLALTSDPAVTVEIDGVPHGRTPLRVAVAAGKRRIRLLDRSKGVDLTRFVVVPPDGTANEAIYLQKGYVSVNAPVGAMIEIDGRQIGKAPLKSEVSVYEGAHKVEVTIGGQKWREAFSVKPNQRVYFDVGPQYQ